MGRKAEVGLAAAAVRQLSQGRASVLAIEGEAGIGKTRPAQSIPDHARLQRLAAPEMPVLVANGDRDPMILPRYSCLLAGLIPERS